MDIRALLVHRELLLELVDVGICLKETTVDDNSSKSRWTDGHKLKLSDWQVYRFCLTQTHVSRPFLSGPSTSSANPPSQPTQPPTPTLLLVVGTGERRASGPLRVRGASSPTPMVMYNLKHLCGNNSGTAHLSKRGMQTRGGGPSLVAVEIGNSMSTKGNSHQGPFGRTNWQLIIAYQCRSCGENCLVDSRSPRAPRRECLSCHSLPTLENPPTRKADDILSGSGSGNGGNGGNR